MINIWAHLKCLIREWILIMKHQRSVTFITYSIHCFSLTILLYTHNTHWAHFVSLILDFFARHVWITVEGRSHYFWDLRGTYMAVVMGRARKFCQYLQTMFSWLEVSHKKAASLLKVWLASQFMRELFYEC